MGERYFSDRVVEWYEKNFRGLPWRDTKDPYRIWLSEIILQQTRVSQGLPYYEKFVSTFPRIEQLAAANEQQVLRLWQGLGYYSRARNLLKCAREVSNSHNNRFPDSFAALRKLPGIGDYTAAAIASFAFGEPVPVVDGNVFRVLSRAFAVEDDIAKASSKRVFFELAQRLIDPERPAAFNQGLMEIGALVCKPVAPDCSQCPLGVSCLARARSIQHLLPVKNKAKAARKRYFYYLVLERAGRLSFRKRLSGDIWQGLFDFPLIEQNRATSLEKLKRVPGEWPAILKNLEVKEISPTYVHILSHQKIFARFISVSLPAKRTLFEKNVRFYSTRQLSELPKPRLITRYLADRGVS